MIEYLAKTRDYDRAVLDALPWNDLVHLGTLLTGRNYFDSPNDDASRQELTTRLLAVAQQVWVTRDQDGWIVANPYGERIAAYPSFTEKDHGDPDRMDVLDAYLAIFLADNDPEFLSDIRAGR